MQTAHHPLKLFFRNSAGQIAFVVQNCDRHAIQAHLVLSDRNRRKQSGVKELATQEPTDPCQQVSPDAKAGKVLLEMH